MSEHVVANSLTAAHSPNSDSELGVRRLNRLPLVSVSVLCVLLLAVLVFAGFQRAEQNLSSVRIGSGFDKPLEPVEAEQAAQTLLREYRGAASACGAVRCGLGRFGPSREEQRSELAYDAHRAPTVVPTDNLYRDTEAETPSEQAFDTQTTAPGAFGLAGEAEGPNLRTPTPDGFLSLTVDYLARQTGMTRKRAERALADLKASGLATIAQPRLRCFDSS